MSHSESGQCICTPTILCARCRARGYKNSLAGYAERIYPQHVTEAEMIAYDAKVARDEAGRRLHIDIYGAAGDCCTVCEAVKS